MIAYDFSSESARVRTGFYNMLSPLGKAHLAQLLREEKKLLSRFKLSYDTPEARKVAFKESKGMELTKEEITLLNNSPKSFLGEVADGDKVTNEKAVSVISNYVDCIDIIDADIKTLGTFEDSKYTANADVILGKPLTYWNLHPNTLPTTIYETIFDSPQYVKNEIEKLVELKTASSLNQQPQRLIATQNAAREMLVHYQGSKGEKDLLAEKLYSLRVVGEASPVEFLNNLNKIINILIDKDNEFDESIYYSVKDLLPQYHNQKLKYFIYLLAQYNSSATVPVNARIDFNILHAFYRKAEELCY